VEKFHRVPILVLGDLMVDRTIRGSVDRISPEAPVPVIDIKEKSHTPGGAGNVVHNLAAMGAAPSLVSVRGDDPIGAQIAKELEEYRVNIAGLFIDFERPTTTKTRVVAGQQQLVRLDTEKRLPLSKNVVSALQGHLKKNIRKHKAVILSDYGKGVICPPIIKYAINEAHRHGVFVSVDPKIEHFFQYQGVDCLTPNTKESIEGMRVFDVKTEDELISLGWRIVKRLKSRSLLITRGEKGMLIFEKGGMVRTLPAEAREVFDVTGAGDTVISVFSLARAVGAPLFEAAALANYAASIVVGKRGTAVATKDELVQLLHEL
jgi:D-beta-D-heptose 7-phosphate kinase/D-beta-D-heptose 1-phosphate adenosyltransferase